MNSVSSLQALTQYSSEASQERSDILLLGDISGKKGKKRKADDEDEESEDAAAVQRKAVSRELVLRCEHILSSVKAACVYDTEGFIDEVRSLLPFNSSPSTIRRHTWSIVSCTAPLRVRSQRRHTKPPHCSFFQTADSLRTDDACNS